MLWKGAGKAKAREALENTLFCCWRLRKKKASSTLKCEKRLKKACKGFIRLSPWEDASQEGASRVGTFLLKKSTQKKVGVAIPPSP